MVPKPNILVLYFWVHLDQNVSIEWVDTIQLLGFGVIFQFEPKYLAHK